MLLRRPFPLQPDQFRSLTAHLTFSETGSLALLIMAYWPEGKFPSTVREAAKILGTKPVVAKRALELLSPHFAPSGAISLLRAAHIVKAGRRGNAGKKALAARSSKVQGRAERPV